MVYQDFNDRFLLALNTCTHSGFKDFFAIVIGSENVNDFVGWAFGLEPDEQIRLLDLPNLWNERHDDIFEFSIHSDFQAKIKEVLRAYYFDVLKNPNVNKNLPKWG